MARHTTYILLMSGLMLMFYITGIIGQGTTPNSTLLTILLNPENIQGTNFVTNVVLAMEAVLVAGVVVLGIITKNFELAVVRAFAIYLLNLGWDFVAVYAQIAAVNQVMAIFIFSPLFLLYGITILDWWRGRDT